MDYNQMIMQPKDTFTKNEKDALLSSVKHDGKWIMDDLIGTIKNSPFAPEEYKIYQIIKHGGR